MSDLKQRVRENNIKIQGMISELTGIMTSQYLHSRKGTKAHKYAYNLPQDSPDIKSIDMPSDYRDLNLDFYNNVFRSKLKGRGKYKHNRSYFKSSKVTKWDPHVTNASIKSGIPKEAIFAMIHQESGGDPTAENAQSIKEGNPFLITKSGAKLLGMQTKTVNGKSYYKDNQGKWYECDSTKYVDKRGRERTQSSARGMGQFLLGTAKNMGLKIYQKPDGSWVDERTDPKKVINAMARYLSKELKRYDGDLSLAIMAYHGGAGNVNKALRAVKQNDFNAAAQFIKDEGLHYTPSVLKYMKEYGA